MSQNIIAICTPTRDISVLISPYTYQQWMLSIFNFFLVQQAKNRISLSFQMTFLYLPVRLGPVKGSKLGIKWQDFSFERSLQLNSENWWGIVGKADLTWERVVGRLFLFCYLYHYLDNNLDSQIPTSNLSLHQVPCLFFWIMHLSLQMSRITSYLLFPLSPPILPLIFLT